MPAYPGCPGKKWPLNGCWRGYLSGAVARCRCAYGPADTTATHCLLLQEIQNGFGFTFLVPAHPGIPGQNPESRKTVVIVVVVNGCSLVVVFSPDKMLVLY